MHEGSEGSEDYCVVVQRLLRVHFLHLPHFFTSSLLHFFTSSLLHFFTSSLLHFFTSSLLHFFTSSLPSPLIIEPPLAGFAALVYKANHDYREEGAPMTIEASSPTPADAQAARSESLTL